MIIIVLISLNPKLAMIPWNIETLQRLTKLENRLLLEIVKMPLVVIIILFVYFLTQGYGILVRVTHVFNCLWVIMIFIEYYVDLFRWLAIARIKSESHET